MTYQTQITLYPGQIDGYLTMPILKDGAAGAGGDEIVAADHNRLRNAIVAIETVLGVSPNGIYASVAHRLNAASDAYAAIQTHILMPTGAHQAAAISFDDPNSYFASSQNALVDNTQDAISKLALMLRRPNYIGENIAHIPNSGIPEFVDGYGTKFIYNVGDFSGEAVDNEVVRTQMRATAGISCINIFEVSPLTPNGDGYLKYNAGNLQWKAPGDSSYGIEVYVPDMGVRQWGTVYSQDITKSLRFARNGSEANLSGERTEDRKSVV
jgi:hypothetical protein